MKEMNREKGMVGFSAGVIKTWEQLQEAVEIPEVGLIVLGSITVEERAGNPGTTYYQDPEGRFTINTKGMPNGGIPYYRPRLPDMVKLAHDHDKLLGVSIAGETPEEYAQLGVMVRDSGADFLEKNDGCPNRWSLDGQQKRITSFNPPMIAEGLEALERAIGTDFWTSVKFSPYSDPSLLAEVAKTIRSFKIVKGLTLCNTFPNAYAFNQAEPALSFGPGLGGLGGDAMREIALGQIVQFKALLPELYYFGSGGISLPGHLSQYLQVGAHAGLVASAYLRDNRVFDKFAK